MIHCRAHRPRHSNEIKIENILYGYLLWLDTRTEVSKAEWRVNNVNNGLS